MAQDKATPFLSQYLASYRPHVVVGHPRFQRPRSLKLRLQIFRKMNPTLRPSKVVETGVYVKDLERAQRFYGDVLSLNSAPDKKAGTSSSRQARACSSCSMRTLH